MEDILARLRREDRRREAGAFALLLWLFGLLMLPSLFMLVHDRTPNDVMFTQSEQPWIARTR